MSKARRPQDLFESPVDNSNTPFWPDFTHLEGIATDLAPDSQPELAERVAGADVELASQSADLSPNSSNAVCATCVAPTLCCFCNVRD